MKTGQDTIFCSICANSEIWQNRVDHTFDNMVVLSSISLVENDVLIKWTNLKNRADHKKFLVCLFGRLAALKGNLVDVAETSEWSTRISHQCFLSRALIKFLWGDVCSHKLFKWEMRSENTNVEYLASSI